MWRCFVFYRVRCSLTPELSPPMGARGGISCQLSDRGLLREVRTSAVALEQQTGGVVRWAV